MKKCFLLLFAICAFSTLLCAEPKVTYGPVFEATSSGANKILQLKSGNTLLFHFFREGIEVTVYDKKRDVIAKRTLTSELWDASKMPSTSLAGLYEISGQPVIFLRQVIDKDFCLFRIIINPETGEIVKEKKISSFHISSKYNLWSGAVTITAGGFIVEKDPYSDFYAIAYSDEHAEDINERIRVVHYNGQHKKLGAAYLELPKNKYLYVNFVAMAVIGDKQVNICTYAYNSKRDKGEDAKVILSKLTAGDSVFVNKELDFTEDFRNTSAIMKYNQGTGMLNLLTLTSLKSKRNTNYFIALINYVDPATLYVTGTVPLTFEKASAYMQSHLDVDGYEGLPQEMMVNPDNTITILMESTRQEIMTRNGTVVSVKTYLGNIGITVLDSKGKEKDGSAILKMQYAQDMLDPLYLHYKRSGAWSYNQNRAMLRNNYNAYLSFDYVSTSGNRYVMFNDRPENFDRDEKKKRKMLEYPDRSNTICYKLNKGEMEKFYLFGEPEERSNKFCNIEASNYLPESNTYATIVVTRTGRDEESRLAWIKFD